jgi:hypothetical protein
MAQLIDKVIFEKESRLLRKSRLVYETD